jgi:hypothetical protein
VLKNNKEKIQNDPQYTSLKFLLPYVENFIKIMKNRSKMQCKMGDVSNGVFLEIIKYFK